MTQPSHYRVIMSTTEEFDLSVTVMLLDEDGEDVADVYTCDDLKEANQWIEEQGGVFITGMCTKCGKHVLSIYGTCECTGTIVALRKETLPWCSLLTGLRAISLTFQGDRNLDREIEAAFTQSVPITPRHLTTNIYEAVAFARQVLSNHAVLTTSQQFRPNHTPMATVTITAPNLNISVAHCNLCFALLDALIQFRILETLNSVD